MEGDRPSTAPMAVATPLPPLKPRNGEKRCPRIGASATTMMKDSLVSHCIAAQPTTHPLPMSPRSVRIPAVLPDTRSTLVNPTFLLPTVRGSGSPIAFDTTMPKGMAPSR